MQAMQGYDAVFYLIHSMESGHGDFAEADRRAAKIFIRALERARASEEGGPERVVYLGGMGDDTPDLSHHLRSRLEVGRILQEGPVPVTFLRAAVILGSGSASFELVRYLCEHLPVMITPRWVRTVSQPIAVRDVLDYLAGCLDHPETAGQTYDIGGPDILSYRDMFSVYCEEAGLGRRLIIPVPVLTPRLSSLWVGFVSPVPTVLARPLIEGLRNRVVCRDNRIRDIIPLELAGVRETIRRAIDRRAHHAVDTCWSDAGSVRLPEWAGCGDAPYAGGKVFEEVWHIEAAASKEAVWKTVERIGGDTGWYHGDFLWSLRGVMDKLVGGVGTRRGRRDPGSLRPGDALDFWRVVEVDSGSRLLLLAEMKLPGEALLDIRVGELAGSGGSEILLLARFLPRGVFGYLYWYATAPLHRYVFPGMLEGIVRASGAYSSAQVRAGARKLNAETRKSCRLNIAPGGRGADGE